MQGPEVLLLDEPANGLGPQARIEMRSLIRRLADGGETILVSSHILPELATICDTVGIIRQGVLQAAGPIDKVLRSLQRDRLIELKAGGDILRIRTVLEASPAVSQIDTAEQSLGVVQFRFGGDDVALAGLLSALVAAQVQTVSFREVPLSLEDAFMALSGMTAQAEPAESAPAASEPSSR